MGEWGSEPGHVRMLEKLTVVQMIELCIYMPHKSGPYNVELSEKANCKIIPLIYERLNFKRCMLYCL